MRRRLTARAGLRAVGPVGPQLARNLTLWQRRAHPACPIRLRARCRCRPAPPGP